MCHSERPEGAKNLLLAKNEIEISFGYAQNVLRSLCPLRLLASDLRPQTSDL
jgi:hypothetical protein